MSNRIRIAGGVAAIWSGEGDTLPFDDPLNHLDRVKFHSALRYVKVQAEYQFTLTLAERKKITSVSADYTLMFHGLGYTPLILGIVYMNGQWCAFTGSVPIQLETPLTGQGYDRSFARFISLGVDASKISVHEYATTYYSNSSFWASYPSINVPIIVWITNEALP